MAAGVGLDVTKWQAAQLFPHTNIDEFLLLPLKSRIETLATIPFIYRAFPLAFANLKEQHTKPKGNK
jgi:hypothetical protein